MTRSSFDLGFFLIARETPALSYGGSLDICTYLEKKVASIGKKSVHKKRMDSWEFGYHITRDSDCCKPDVHWEKYNSVTDLRSFE